MVDSVITTHPFDDAYASRAGALPSAPWLDRLRGDAYARLAAGLPGPKVEEWRFTPLKQLSRIGFVPAAAANDIDVTVVPYDVPKVPDEVRLVLVNGVYRPDLSDPADGLEVEQLSEAIAAGEGRIGDVASLELPMVMLNTAFMDDGLVITARRPMPRPVHLVFIGASGSEPAAFHARIAIKTLPGASLTVVESHVGLPGQPFFTNPVVEIDVAEDASVYRCVSVREDGDAFHFATAVANVAARGVFHSFHLGLSGQKSEGTVRQEIHVAVNGEGAAVNVSGAYALAGTAHHDFTTVIDHRVGGSASRQVFKGVLDGKAHGVYQGRIHVGADAQKTDARQLHKALFLTQGPVVDCKPELEINADDVQCAHGATTGALDPDQLFYLAARGIDPESARALLVEGFLTDAIGEVGNDALRSVMTGQMSGWLRRRGGEL